MPLIQSADELQSHIATALKALKEYYPDVDNLLTHLDEFDIFAPSGFKYLDRYLLELTTVLNNQTNIDLFTYCELKYFKTLAIIAKLISRNPAILDDKNIAPLITVWEFSLENASDIYARHQEKLRKKDQLIKSRNFKLDRGL